MNEPIQHAQKSTGKVTARSMLAMIRAGSDALYMHGRASHDRASYSDSYIFSVSCTSKDRKTKTETVTQLDVPGYVTNGSTSEKEETGTGGDRYVRFVGVYRPMKGFWSLSTQRQRLLDILELLPADAEIAFRVNLDYGTHEYLVRSRGDMNYEGFNGLHCDHLYLVVRYTSRGKERNREYFIDSHTVPHNTARFGAPGSRID